MNYILKYTMSIKLPISKIKIKFISCVLFDILPDYTRKIWQAWTSCVDRIERFSTFDFFPVCERRDQAAVWRCSLNCTRVAYWSYLLDHGDRTWGLSRICAWWSMMVNKTNLSSVTSLQSSCTPSIPPLQYRRVHVTLYTAITI